MILSIGLSLLSSAAFAQAGTTWQQIGDLFARRCVKCHSGFDAPLGLSLDSYDAALSGSWNGKVVVAGDTAASPLLRRLRGEAVPRMPLDGPPFLTPEEMALIEAWVLDGMPKGVASGMPITAAVTSPQPGSPVTFAHVERIFLKSCMKCHSDNSKLGAPPEGLRMSSYEAILAGGDRLVLLPGNPEMSEIWRRVSGLGLPRMPFDGPPWLPQEDIDLIRAWISDGARDRDGNPAPVPEGASVRLRGVMTAQDAIDGARFQVAPSTRIDDQPRVGSVFELRGTVLSDGSVLATRLRER